MSEKITIDVTAEDIANGIPETCDRCPIALAAKRLGEKTYAQVFRSRIELYNGFGQWVCFKTPPVARAFIRRFDKHRPVQPFTFELASA